MYFFNGLSRELSNTGRTTEKNMNASAKEAEDMGADADLFYKLAENTFLTDLAYHEQGRANHMMLKTTFDSFQ